LHHHPSLCYNGIITHRFAAADERLSLKTFLQVEQRKQEQNDDH